MQFPFVSVIIPVLNESISILKVLKALKQQTYLKDRFEIIIVDNGSVDDTKQQVEQFEVTLLEEHKIKSPYAARNKGLKIAKGNIVAFTDGNKVPRENWLEKGVKCLIQNNCDLVGGRVAFSFSKRKSIGEILDSINFLDNEKYVKEEKASLGGNLFFWKRVLEEMGDFPKYRSGMDIYWTRKAVDAGFDIMYCPEAVVYSVARPIKSTLKKSYRIGVGHPMIMQNAGQKKSTIIYHSLRTFLPPSPLVLYSKIQKRGEKKYFYYFILLWGADYCRRIAMALGRLKGLKDL